MGFNACLQMHLTSSFKWYDLCRWLQEIKHKKKCRYRIKMIIYKFWGPPITKLLNENWDQVNHFTCIVFSILCFFYIFIWCYAKSLFIACLYLIKIRVYTTFHSEESFNHLSTLNWWDKVTVMMEVAFMIFPVYSFST